MVLAALDVAGCRPVNPGDGDAVPAAQLAFVSDRGEGDELDIYLTDTDTTFFLNLSRATGEEYGLSWSPDGRRLAFGSNASDNQEIYILTIGDTTRVNFSRSETAEWSPNYAQDGRRIAFTSDRDHPSREIYLSDVGGRSPERITFNTDYDASPRFSPDGSQLALCRQITEIVDGEERKNGEIFVMDLADRSESRLTDGPTFDCLPNWSPDGSRIAYHSCGDDRCEIRIVEADGSRDTVLVADEFDDRWPEWSPDGEWIAYTSVRQDQTDIWIVKQDGTGSRALTSHPGRDEIAVWRPRLSR